MSEILDKIFEENKEQLILKGIKINENRFLANREAKRTSKLYELVIFAEKYIQDAPKDERIELEAKVMNDFNQLNYPEPEDKRKLTPIMKYLQNTPELDKFFTEWNEE